MVAEGRWTPAQVIHELPADQWVVQGHRTEHFAKDEVSRAG